MHTNYVLSLKSKINLAVKNPVIRGSTKQIPQRSFIRGKELYNKCPYHHIIIHPKLVGCPFDIHEHALQKNSLHDLIPKFLQTLSAKNCANLM